MKQLPTEVQAKKEMDRRVRQRLIELRVQQDCAVQDGDYVLASILDTDIKIMESILTA